MFQLVSVQDLFPNVYALGFKAGQTVASIGSVLVPSTLYDTTNHTNHTTKDAWWSIATTLSTTTTTLWSVPLLYQEWWWNLVAEDPIHVAVETTLVATLIYILFLSRWMSYPFSTTTTLSSLSSTASSTTASSTATSTTTPPTAPADEARALARWKQTRAPLTPPEERNDDPDNDDQDRMTLPRRRVIVHQQGGRTMRVQWIEPSSHDDITITTNTTTTTTTDPTTNTTSNVPPLSLLYTVLNMSTFDFWGMNCLPVDGNTTSTTTTTTTTTTLEHAKNEGKKKKDKAGSKQQQQQQQKKKNPNNNNNSNSTATNTTNSNNTPDELAALTEHARLVKQAAHDALDRYGCGACGPRGFYGTVDVHLQLERRMADLFQCQASILYSDGASTLSSTVAAFAKRGDLIVADEAISEPLRTGVLLSRAHVKWFPHNDMLELRRILEKLRAQDQARHRPPHAQRRFLVVEGLYRTTGQVCPLPQLIPLKHEFAYRLILDESFSFGTLGPTGKGVLELFQKKIQEDAEIVTISLEHAVGSIGGVTIGSHEVVDHQRLCGAGYCFSASAPPFSATAAMAALNIMATRPHILQRLNDNKAYLYQRLKTWCADLDHLLLVTSDEQSPIVLLQVAELPATQYLNQDVFFDEVVRECLELGVAVTSTQTRAFAATATATLGTAAATTTLSVVPAPAMVPALRLIVTAVQTRADLDLALAVLRNAVDVVMAQFHEDIQEDEEEEENTITKKHARE